MGNMRGWGGPLSSTWHNHTINLQHQILKRMRGLGIIPVLPAFAGHVPRAFKKLFPSAQMTKVSTWNKFEDKYCWSVIQWKTRWIIIKKIIHHFSPYLVSPTDVLFEQIGKTFLQTVRSNYKMILLILLLMNEIPAAIWLHESYFCDLCRKNAIVPESHGSCTMRETNRGSVVAPIFSHKYEKVFILIL